MVSFWLGNPPNTQEMLKAKSAAQRRDLDISMIIQELKDWVSNRTTCPSSGVPTLTQ